MDRSSVNIDFGAHIHISQFGGHERFRADEYDMRFFPREHDTQDTGLTWENGVPFDIFFKLTKTHPGFLLRSTHSITPDFEGLLPVLTANYDHNLSEPIGPEPFRVFSLVHGPNSGPFQAAWGTRIIPLVARLVMPYDSRRA